MVNFESGQASSETWKTPVSRWDRLPVSGMKTEGTGRFRECDQRRSTVKSLVRGAQGRAGP